MIKAIILDIDGVILGHHRGLNFPLPSALVLGRLQNLAKTIPITLCTVKAYFAVQPIIEACGLQASYHVTDAGAEIINSSLAKTLTTEIDFSIAKKLIEDLRRSEIYTEWYTSNEYYALDHAVLHWGMNPSLLPRMASFFTNPLATKRTGIEKISTLTSLALSETLAVGDSTNDWTFMELCGYVATLGNGTPELKELVKNKENGNGYITKKTVNQDGILDIFDHFGV